MEEELKDVKISKSLSKKQKLFLEAFRKHATNATKACEAVNIDRSTYYNWNSTNPTFKRGCEDAHESMIDFAESALYRNIKDGKESSINFYLKTRGKKRGYVERQEIEYSGDGLVSKIEIEIIE